MEYDKDFHYDTPHRNPHRHTVYPVRHHPYGHDSSISSPYRHEPFRSVPCESRSVPCESEPSRISQDEIRTLMTGQAELKEVIKDLHHRIEKLEEKLDEKGSNSSSQKLPPELSKTVAQVYKNFEDISEKFDLSKGSSDKHNLDVKKRIKEEVMQGNTRFSPPLVQRAVQRYFQSRKRGQREAENMPVAAREAQNKKRKIRARKVRLFERRKKVLMEGQEKERFECVNIDCMSDESSGSEDNMVVHRPVWRSQALNKFLSKLDERAGDSEIKKPNPRKARVAGSIKDCYPPKYVKAWMVSKRWTTAHPDFVFTKEQ